MIIGEIRRYLRDDGMLKVSRNLKENCARIYSAREALEKNWDVNRYWRKLRKRQNFQ